MVKRRTFTRTRCNDLMACLQAVIAMLSRTSYEQPQELVSRGMLAAYIRFDKAQNNRIPALEYALCSNSLDFSFPLIWLFSARREMIKVGDRVRVKPSVTTPKYKWGSVNHGSVGTVVSISPNGKDVKVDFPQQTNWTGLISEMEVVPATHPRTR